MPLIHECCGVTHSDASLPIACTRARTRARRMWTAVQSDASLCVTVRHIHTRRGGGA